MGRSHSARWKSGGSHRELVVLQDSVDGPDLARVPASAAELHGYQNRGAVSVGLRVAAVPPRIHRGDVSV